MATRLLQQSSMCSETLQPGCKSPTLYAHVLVIHMYTHTCTCVGTSLPMLTCVLLPVLLYYILEAACLYAHVHMHMYTCGSLQCVQLITSCPSHTHTHIHTLRSDSARLFHVIGSHSRRGASRHTAPSCILSHAPSFPTSQSECPSSSLLPSRSRA